LRDSRKRGAGGDDVDLAVLVDGPEAGRRQGNIINAAYR
jgi:sulfate adenylyltransferase subunit 1 (EFTu-like GTPase family)